MLSPLTNLDWHEFLARPMLPPPSAEALKALIRRPILITGAGGSIGSALAMRLQTMALARLILLEASESNLYALQRDCAEAELTNAGAACPITFLLGNAADRGLLDEIFAVHAPGIVFHAAAFKQVPLMEEQPFAAIANNVFATETLADVADRHGARLLLLSTDKAVAPASVMGATKRVAEQIVLRYGGTVARLANVLASRDSVVEVFYRQIARFWPIPVTSATARRYFLTLEEAVNLLLSAAVETEPATLLVPNLAEQHLIVDLARFMAGVLRPGEKLDLANLGSRAGDKECEELWLDGELTSEPRPDGLVAVETPQPTPEELQRHLANLRAALDSRDLSAALARLQVLVPDYSPSSAVLEMAQHDTARVCS